MGTSRDSNNNEEQDGSKAGHTVVEGYVKRKKKMVP